MLIKKEQGINIWPQIKTGDITDEVEDLLLKYQYTKELYGWLNPFPYAASTLRSLANMVDIIYITARPISTKAVTQAWMDDNLFPPAKIINVRKSKIPAVRREGVDIFIEDRLMYVLPLAETGMDIFLLNLYDITYDVDLPSNVFVVYNWAQVYGGVINRVDGHEL